MTYINACGDLCDDEDIYSCVLEYLIDNCPHYADLREVETDDYQFSSIDENALHWEKQMKV
jgi:hypothetical protein